MFINEENYVDEAEKVICALKEDAAKNRREPLVTTSKIRNLLSLTSDIYNEVVHCREEKLSSEICSRIEYLRVRFVYESGRDVSVKNFTIKAKILDILKEIRGNKTNYILFSRYIEALVAFHRFYGGKDN